MYKDVKYLLAYTLPISAIVGVYLGGYWSFLGLYVAFIILPILEIFLPQSLQNFGEEEEMSREKRLLFDVLLYLNLPLLYSLIGYFVYRYVYTPLDTYEVVGMTISVGIICGVLGINVAHELGHRSKWYETLMSKSLLLSCLYMHFYIEHNRGHHKNVSTPLDPATSRFNESFYAFLPRTVIGSWRSAWHLETHRLQKLKLSLWNPIHNEMLRFQIIQIAFVLLIYFIFGWIGAVGFIAASVIGFTLLEIVNYIEHYGLQRQQLANGAYEKVKPHHSWNSAHEFGRILLFELTRHSDHHYNPSRKYQILRHFKDAPQMPSGYLAMMPLALVPPLWFKIMNPLVIKHNATISDDYLNKIE